MKPSNIVLASGSATPGTVLTCVCLALALTMQAAQTAASPSQPRLEQRYLALALEGDLRRAADLLLAPENASRRPHLAEAFSRRFVEGSDDPAPTGADPFLSAVLARYHAYWKSALLGTLAPAQAEARLKEELNNYIYQYDRRYLENDYDIFAVLQRALNDRAYEAIVAPNSPWHDLVVWRQQKQVSYTVQLTDRRARVTVVFIDQIFSQGWTHYASLGLASTSGWADAERLYCLCWQYDISSENFAVSYLKHESRHLMDYRLFPALGESELEYRAKLTELAHAYTTLPRLLRRFTRAAAAQSEAPHAAANYRVTRDLFEYLRGAPWPDSGDPWLGLSVIEINRAARDLLRRDTERLARANEPGGSLAERPSGARPSHLNAE